MSDNANPHPPNLPWWVILLENMHPTVKTIFFTVIVIPLTFAVSGMLLNINIGSMFDIMLEDWRATNKHNIEQMKNVNNRLVMTINKDLNENTKELKNLTKTIVELGTRYDTLRDNVDDNRLIIDRIMKRLNELNNEKIKSNLISEAQLKECQGRIIGNSIFACEGVKPVFCKYDYKTFHTFNDEMIKLIGGYGIIDEVIENININDGGINETE